MKPLQRVQSEELFGMSCLLSQTNFTTKHIVDTCNYKLTHGVYYNAHIPAYKQASFPLLLSKNIQFQFLTPNPNHRTSPRPIAGLQSGFVIPICNRLWAAPKKRRRKFSTFYAPLIQPTSDSIKVWPRAEKILSNPDWLVVIKHSKEFPFVLLKIGRGSGVLKTNGQFSRGLGRPCDDAIDSQVTRVLTRLVRGRFQSHC